MATFTLALIKSGYHSGDVSLAGLLSFGNSQSLGDAQMRLVNPDGTVTQVLARQAFMSECWWAMSGADLRS
eukprot:3514607-Rhodomonas_salina.1